MSRHQPGKKFGKTLPRLFSGLCPVTGGRPTRMLRRTFSAMCVRAQLEWDSSCRFICKGRWPQAGLELIDDVKNFASEEDNIMAAKAGTCELCGKAANVKRIREKSCCATCEHVWRAAHNAPALLIEALNQVRGETYLREKVGAAVPADYDDMKRRLHAMEQTYENMRLALGCQGDEAALESVIRLVKERDGALDDLQQIRVIVGPSRVLPLPEYIESMVNDKAEATRQLRAALGVIESVREMLGLDEDEAIVEAVHQLLRDRKKAIDIWFETAEIMGVTVPNADQMPIRARELMEDMQALNRHSVAVTRLSEIRKVLGMGPDEDVVGRVSDLKIIYCDAIKTLECEVEGGLLKACQKRMDELRGAHFREATFEGESINPDEYQSLRRVLDLALDQAANGKGKERHANEGEPFEKQKICEISRRVGLAFPIGQAIKKAEESVRLGLDAGIRENLGAINYLAAAVIVMEETVARSSLLHVPV